MALHLARPKRRLRTNPSLIHLFSTSSSSSSGNEPHEQQSQPPSSSSSSPSDFKISSYFSGIRSNPSQSSFSGNRISTNFDELKRNLIDFRAKAAPPSSPSPSAPARNLQDLYKQRVQSKDRKFEGTSFESVRANLRQMRSPPPQGNTTTWSSLSSLQSLTKTKPNENIRSSLFGGEREELPMSVFGDEIEEGKKKEEEMKSELIKHYSSVELGEILRRYRPEGKKKEEGWFSLQELNQRLVKLREVEEEEAQRIRKGSPLGDIKTGIQLKKGEEAKRLLALQKFDFFSVLSGSPKYLLEPPKEQLVETYFHKDNMSSAEKMKIELAKVREEFKMSESDCGSARVQVAQLTTKIKHLSSVLHKKDKHSRKGLLAMVQRRKKLLKYMRRTDWDSYCLSLSKLGLRDNPDYKF